MFGLFGGSPENLSQGFRRADIQVDPDIEDTVELAGLANPELDSYAAVGTIPNRSARRRRFPSLRTRPAQEFKFRNRIPQFPGGR